MSNAFTMTEACPSCDSPRIAERTTKEPAYRCEVCRNRFEEPLRRRSKWHASGAGGDEHALRENAYEELVPAMRAIVDAGQRYVKAHHIASRVDAGPSYIGSLLKEIGLERGDVSLWSDGGSQNTWHIELDADGAEVEK